MSLDSAYFDQWYADLATSPAREAIVARALGLPPELRFAGILPWSGLADLTSALRLPPDGLLLDLACGRGAYGVEVARRAGARLVGVDFSAVAVGQAAALSAGRLPVDRFTFTTGTLDESGQPASTVDAVMCVDAVQFAEPPLVGLEEMRRVLRPGGRVALTCWEGVGAEVPARIRAVDLARDLPRAGFEEVEVLDRPDWRAAERRLWEMALEAVDPDPAVRSLQEEARRSLDTFDAMHRVFATATAP
ncbi:class I SAM-dependent methyltransferase [Cryptosporangium phraense]|uniref:class I SAM-dependent methyltransferase n=1 Tax=Cryptosporangium phraense TaxID=2593070 RepID=UPI0014786191|nr:methyltransferase domain-containing protein [Cryptosporangium phraense]